MFQIVWKIRTVGCKPRGGKCAESCLEISGIPDDDEVVEVNDEADDDIRARSLFNWGCPSGQKCCPPKKRDILDG